ncbi:MAG: MATE family efflux transporter [Lachnospiraceae bacterium]
MSISRDERLGTEKITKLMFSMGIPGLFAQLINLLYNIVDRSYIGHIEDVGATALTGIGICMPIIIIITAFSSFVGGGGAPLASIAMGQKDNEQAEKYLGNGVTMLVIFSVVLMVIFLWVNKPFLYLIGASDATYFYAGQYITIYLLGTIFVQLTVGLNPFITAQGASTTAMVSVLIGAIINIVLDPILIFGFNMGVRGAALATIISQAVSAFWVIYFLTSKKATVRIRKKYLRPDWKVIKKSSALGISPFIMQSTEAMISIVMNSGLQTYGGDLYVGSLTILQSTMQMITVPLNGFAQSVMPIISYNYGAGNKKRVTHTFRNLLILLTIAAALIAGMGIIAPEIFALFFTNDVAMIQLVKKVMPIFMFGMIFFGIQMTCQTTFMALGQAKLSLFVALFRKVLLLVPLALILPKVTGNVMGIYYSEPISDIISVVTCGVLFLINFKTILSKCPSHS